MPPAARSMRLCSADRSTPDRDLRSSTRPSPRSADRSFSKSFEPLQSSATAPSQSARPRPSRQTRRHILPIDRSSDSPAGLLRDTTLEPINTAVTIPLQNLRVDAERVFTTKGKRRGKRIGRMIFDFELEGSRVGTRHLPCSFSQIPKAFAEASTHQTHPKNLSPSSLRALRALRGKKQKYSHAPILLRGRSVSGPGGSVKRLVWIQKDTKRGDISVVGLLDSYDNQTIRPNLRPPGRQASSLCDRESQPMKFVC